MSAMVSFSKELPQNTAVIQSEHTEPYSKSSNEQRHLEAVYDIRGATCISVFFAESLVPRLKYVVLVSSKQSTLSRPHGQHFTMVVLGL